MDRKTRKIMTVNRRYHARSDNDRLCNARMEGGKVLLSIIDCVEQNISRHLEHLEGRLLRFSKSEMILPQYGGPLSTANEQKREKRHKQWKEKQTQRWIKKGYLKKETEGLIFAGQVKALRMNWKRKNIDDQQVLEKCRICEEIDESITHLFAECKKLAQKEHKQRNNNVARIVHLELYRKFGLVGEVKWYNGLKQLRYTKLKEGLTLILLCLGQKDQVERTGKDRQLQRTKTGSEKDLELVSSCGCSSCNWSPVSGIKTITRLAEEVRCKEQYRAFAKSNIAWNYKHYQASPGDLRLLGVTCSLGSVFEVPTKPR